MSETVGIVIVSHSKDIAKGTADMVRQMVGSEVRVAFCGGNPDGGLGTSVSLIIDAINDAWSAKGVAIPSISAAPKQTVRWRSKCWSLHGAISLSYATRRSLKAPSWPRPRRRVAAHWPR